MSLWERAESVLTWLPMPSECMTSTLAASASLHMTTTMRAAIRCILGYQSEATTHTLQLLTVENANMMYFT